MKKKIILYIVCAFSLGFTSCGDFLEEYSQNQRYAKTAEDLDELLRGECFMEFSSYYSSNTQETMSYGSTTGFPINYPWLHVMDDDSEEYVLGGLPYTSNYPRNVLGSFYRWGSDPFSTLNNDFIYDQDWTRLYKHIGALNSIIYMAGDLRSKEKDVDLLNKVEGEARFLRAGYYFLLVNMYGMPYCKATASKDMGVPLKISEGVEDKYFSRNSVEEVYLQIVDDLKQATVCLKGVTPKNTLRAGEAAAYALLSRVYLYMERYEECIAAANSAMDDSHSIVNLNKLSASDNFISWTSPETLFTQGGNSLVLTFLSSSMDYSDWQHPTTQALSFQASKELLQSYENEDLRLSAFFKNTTTPNKYKSWTDYQNTDKVGMDFLIRLPEVLLNKAEALAVLGRDADAKIELDRLRSNRFVNASTISETGANLIDYVRAERRRELCFEGHRWFDLRRYAVNSIRPLPDNFTIRHIDHELDATSKTWSETGYYELKSYATDQAAWMVPIPSYAIEFNRGELKNMVRPNRELIRN